MLQPVEKAIRTASGTVRWYLAGSAQGYQPPGEALQNSAEVQAFEPGAILAPGNVVPHRWPGLKVQLFHGVYEGKPGHYRVTGFFDLYCTQSPYMTSHFQELAQRHGHFLVRETGWPKLDPLAAPIERKVVRGTLGLDPNRPVVLYAPTFSPRFTSAPDLLATIVGLKERYQWLIKFHDLTDPAVKAKYEAQLGPQVVGADHPDILPLMQASDLLITDTSSVAYEYLLLDRPIITFRAAVRRDKGIDITAAEDLPAAIEQSLREPDEFAARRQQYRSRLHPYTDGKSAQRVVAAITEILSSDLHLKLRRKPRNLWRKFQQRNLVE